AAGAGSVRVLPAGVGSLAAPVAVAGYRRPSLDCPWLVSSGWPWAGFWRWRGGSFARGGALRVSWAEGLVGREAELALAAAAVRQLSGGRASALGIEGGAGIGRDRLAQSIVGGRRSYEVAGCSG